MNPEAPRAPWAHRRPLQTLDTTGEVCPYPALKMKEALQALPFGEILEVYTNNGATVSSSLPVLCRALGAQATVEAQGDRWRILIQRA